MVTRRGGLFVFITSLFFVIAINLQAGWLYLISAFLFINLLASIFTPLLFLQSLQIKRKVPQLVQAESPVSLSLSVKNRGRSKLLIVCQDEFAGDTGKVTIPYLKRNEEITLSYSITPKRGVYQGGTVRIVCAFPFGLFRWTKKLYLSSEMVVYPEIIPLKNLPILETGSFPREHHHAYRKSYGGEYYGVREYQPQDPLRFIHWKKTAASVGKLIVKEFEERVSSYFHVYIDTYQPSLSEKCFETLIKAAASMAHYAIHTGHPLILSACYGKNLISRVRPDLPETLSWFAQLEPLGEVSFEQGVSQLAKQVPNFSTVALVTAGLNLPTHFTWPQLLQRRRCRLVLFLFEEKLKTDSSYHSLLKKLEDNRVLIYRCVEKESLERCLREPWSFTRESTAPPA